MGSEMCIRDSVEWLIEQTRPGNTDYQLAKKSTLVLHELTTNRKEQFQPGGQLPRKGFEDWTAWWQEVAGKQRSFHAQSSTKHRHQRDVITTLVIIDRWTTISVRAEPQRGSTSKPGVAKRNLVCLLYTSPSPRDLSTSRMPSSA